MNITDEKQIDAYYRALLDRAADHVGVFYVGVKTTGVFCIATCRARKPKRENVLFYRTFKDALDAGFRPCKICRPTENAHAAPPDVARALEWLRHHPVERLSDWQLKQQGISPLGFTSSKVKTSDFDHFDYLIAMDDNNLAELERLFGRHPDKMFKLTDLTPTLGYDHVPDPWYTDNFDETYELVRAGSDALLKKLNLL